jgi:putative protease
MITIKEPGYSGSSAEVIKDIQDKYVSKNITLPISGYVRIRTGEHSQLTFFYKDLSVTVSGDEPSKAQNRPLDESEIGKRIRKLGDTCFELTNLDIDTDNESFMAVKAINELRRKACEELTNSLCELKMPKSSKGSRTISFEKSRIKDNQTGIANKLSVLVSTESQLVVANKEDGIDMIYVNADIFLYRKGKESLLQEDREYALVLPHILRKRSYKYFDSYLELLDLGKFKGVMVRNFEELEWLNEIGYKGQIYSDYTVYAWNNKALDFYDKQFDKITLPVELNKKELGLINNNGKLSFLMYGYIPLMYSANCIQNTLEGCINDLSGNKHIYRLTDRYKNVFSIEQNCLHCYNILYNTVPLSLHGQIEGILKRGINELRLDFSIESDTQTREVLSFYKSLIFGRENNFEVPFKDFTNGHYKRGVE